MLDVHEVYIRAGITAPRIFQEGAWVSILAGKNTLISAGTGSGKTEAALLPALETGKRTLILYPTKALLQDQHERVTKLAIGKSIAIDTGDQDDRHFYHADVIVTSLDKFLYRFFGYGKKRWSYLYPYRIGFTDDRSSLLVLDEAHAYEDVAFSHLWFLLKKLTYERRIQTVVLSATLPLPLIEALEDSARQNFPRGDDEGAFFDRVEDHENRSGVLTYGGLVQASDVVGKSLRFFDQGKRVIVVTRRVIARDSTDSSDGLTVHDLWARLADAIGLRGTSNVPVASLASLRDDVVEGNVLTYHGHQMPQYRRRVLQRLKTLDETWTPADQALAGRQPFVLLTTSAMEVGVDISCDVMITDLCEPDSFIQRTGRCARRATETGDVYLVAPPEGRIIPHGTKSLWDFMQQRPPGSPLDAEVKQDLNKLNHIPDLKAVPLRLEYLQDLSLYRYVYDFVQENRELWEKGVLITREWEPSIAVVISENDGRGDYIGGIPARDFWRAKEIKEKLLLPLSGAADIAPYCAWVFEGYNEANQYTQRVAVGGSKERTLVEALRLAGVSARSRKQDGNKVQPIYALGLPLILILGNRREGTKTEHDAIWPYGGPNVGLCYRRQFAKLDQEPKVFSPSPRLKVRKVLLRKEKGTYELPVYWFEPNEQQPGEEGTA
jgi:CRISPR-associated endonuclease/helicase Cas3